MSPDALRSADHNARPRRSGRLGTGPSTTTTNADDGGNTSFRQPPNDILTRINSSQGLVPIPTSSGTTDFSPPLLDFTLSSNGSSPLSSPPASPSSVQEDDLLRDLPLSSQPNPNPMFTCPLCLKHINLSFLPPASHPNPKKRMNMREQTLFCRSHKTHTAKREYIERGYPDIDWEGLHGRVEGLCNIELKDVLEGRRKSWYRDAMEREMKISGRRNRSAAQLMMSSGGGGGGGAGDDKEGGMMGSWRGRAGYFGPRGAHMLYVFKSLFFLPSPRLFLSLALCFTPSVRTAPATVSMSQFLVLRLWTRCHSFPFYSNLANRSLLELDLELDLFYSSILFS